jgi:hypothetical protein
LTPYKCAMIYGQLPPETRSVQARLFNDDNTGERRVLHDRSDVGGS